MIMVDVKNTSFLKKEFVAYSIFIPNAPPLAGNEALLSCVLCPKSNNLPWPSDELFYFIKKYIIRGLKKH